MEANLLTRAGEAHPPNHLQKIYKEPSGKRSHNYGKIHHIFYGENPLFLWPFSSSQTVRREKFSDPIPSPAGSSKSPRSVAWHSAAAAVAPRSRSSSWRAPGKQLTEAGRNGVGRKKWEDCGHPGMKIGLLPDD